MRKLKHSVVVVTGASSGIGRATALKFAGEGAAVVVTARRAEPLDRLVHECRDAGAEALAVVADVTDDEAVERVAREAVGRFGRIDVWVNNAAVHQFAPLEEAPPQEWRRVVETNVFGTYHGMRAVLPWFREQGSGVIVNVSSVLGKVGSPYQSAYVASKHAVRALSDCVRQEVADLPGISVCTVLPGPVDTPLFHHAGNYTGRQVKPLKPVLGASRVADAIVVCARRPRREAIVGLPERDVLGLRRIAPGFVEWLTARQVDRDHYADAPAPPQPGNVLEPQDTDGDGVSGGWTRAGRHVGPDDRRAASVPGGRRRRLVAAAGVAGAAVAVARARSR